jgi:hypothetical protein
MIPLDYGLSFVIGNGPANEVRFWVESRTRLIDERAGTHEDYLQCGSCKSENTFAEKDLFQEINYDFLPVFGPEWGVVFRRRARLDRNYRETRPAEQWWDGQVYHLTEGKARELASNAEILEATYANAPIVAQVEIADTGSGLRAIIECPVKTMNTNRERQVYQVDTGPVMLPDLERHARSVDGLRLAYVAFNVPRFADFVVEAPTVIGDAPATTEVHHYRERISLHTTNRLFALEG